MMSPVLFSWLGTAAVAPFVTILSAWTLIVFNSYRQKWRVVDVFLFSVTAYEMAYSLFGFSLAVLSIIRPTSSVPCDAVVLGLTAGRTFHLAAVTSWLLDRALISRRPYCRASHGSQIRYNMVVLGAISVFVGLTAVFARSSVDHPDACSVHPLSWDFKFSAFLSSVYAMLILTGLVCCAVWFFSANLQYTRSMPPLSSSWKSGISSCSSNSSEFLKQENVWDNVQCDWRTVVLVCWIPYCLNHGPYVVMSFMGIVHPDFWTSWVDNATVWMGLAQGFLVPLALMTVDVPYRRAMKAILRRPGKFYSDLADGAAFQKQLQDTKQRISPIFMYPSPRFLPFQTSLLHMPHKLRWTPTSLPSLQSFGQDAASKCQSPVSYGSTDQTKESYEGYMTPSAAYSQDTYSTLGSSCYTMLSFKSRSQDTATPSSVGQQQQEADCDQSDGASITTNALDDFEFLGGKVSEAVPARIKTVTGGDLGRSEHSHAPKNGVSDNKKPRKTNFPPTKISGTKEVPIRGKKFAHKNLRRNQSPPMANNNNNNNKVRESSNQKFVSHFNDRHVIPNPAQISAYVEGFSGNTSTLPDVPPSQMSEDSLETPCDVQNLKVIAGSSVACRPPSRSPVENAIGCRFTQRLWRSDVLYSEYL